MKLKSLSLCGFKSFADKTVFSFHDGITCIVGPNGCGKSNVVDAFKWVLGEQSAKSLRGGEMLDVIFNGTSARRSAGFAEVALTFEDFAGVLGGGGQAQPDPGLELDSDADAAQKPRKRPAIPQEGSVTIARRLYRSGESEYLVNNKPARLKDIREMFLDTGAGVDAYSVIEQGRVESFLQASAADRRALFDEAAGISKYKARKKEALRRLERVEQNLLRLNDILAEVAKRLRSIKYQAGKARNYQEYSAKLAELRSLFSLAEYHRLGKQRKELQAQADGLTDQLAGLNAQIDQLETARTATETELADLERLSRELDAKLATVTAQVDTCQQRVEMLTARVKELSDAVATDLARCEQLEAHLQTTAGEIAGQQQRMGELEGQLEQLAGQEQAIRTSQSEAASTLQQIRAQLEDEKNGTIDLLRRTSQLHNELNAQVLRRENLSGHRQRLTGRAEEIAQALENLLARQAGLKTRLEEVASVLADTQQRLGQTQQRARQLEQEDLQVSEELSRAQQAHSAMLSRQSVLDEMQRRLEGVGEGVRRVHQAGNEGRLAFVRGMLGEFIDTDVAHARTIQAALAGVEQHLLAERLTDVLDAAGTIAQLVGDTDSVEFICLDTLTKPQANEKPQAESAKPPADINLAGQVPSDPAILAGAMDWVRCDSSVAGAVQSVLGRTLIVASLADAARIAAVNPLWRFVTQAGEILEADGHVRIGAGQNAAGVIWRKSELADLARRLTDSQDRIDQLTERRRQIRTDRQHADGLISSLRTAVYEANTERVEQQSLLERAGEQITELRREEPLLDSEVRQLAEQIEQAVRKEHEAQQRAGELEALRQEREAAIAALQVRHDEAAKRQEALNADMTSARVAVAEAQQKRAALRDTIGRLQRACEGTRVELEGLRRQIEQSRQRQQEAQQGIAQGQNEIHTLLEQKAELTREAAETAESRRGLEQRLAEIRASVAAARKSHEGLANQLNALRVQLGEAEVRIEGLIARTKEELNLDLPSSYALYRHDEGRDWEAVRQEIADLRGKIERLGNVNLDAIAEQDELTQREKFLAGQLEDIKSSQGQLAELIKRINAESRRRFEESYQAVRSHFNDLFRKLFGGGKADILLSNPDDALESDIEIVARPPGKELCSITLMSGGEKTMTALALLFSFFKARPSPFCLLDEVDAALDEANTGRFTQLVREFLSSSQFVMISHSKRTIAMADQIYGVTMQEPGVSRQISVKFEEAARLVQAAGAKPKSPQPDAPQPVGAN